MKKEDTKLIIISDNKELSYPHTRLAVSWLVFFLLGIVSGFYL